MSWYKSEKAARTKTSRTSAIAVQHRRRTKRPIWVDLPDEAFPPAFCASAEEFVAPLSGRKSIPVVTDRDQNVIMLASSSPSATNTCTNGGQKATAPFSSFAVAPINSDGQHAASSVTSLNTTPIHFSGDQEVALPISSPSATPNITRDGLRATAPPFYSNYITSCGLETVAPSTVVAMLLPPLLIVISRLPLSTAAFATKANGGYLSSEPREVLDQPNASRWPAGRTPH